jgi:hypothetical protein
MGDQAGALRVPVIRHYATVAHARQVPVLFASMQRHCRPFVLHTLAWDYAPADIGFAAVDEGGYAMTRADFLRRHPDYAPDRLPGPPRRPVDEVVTMRWRFFADVMEATGEPLTCIDGDLFAFGPPDDIFDEIGDARCAVLPHAFAPAAAGLPGVTLESHRRYGLWNCGLAYMADQAIALEMAALNREWSYTEVRARADGGWDFGDQGHWERVAARHGAHVIANPAGAPGPWNIHTQALEVRDGVVFFGDRRLCFYHYSSMRLGQDGAVKIADQGYEITEKQRRILYDPYLEALTNEAGRSNGAAGGSMDGHPAGGS